MVRPGIPGWLYNQTGYILRVVCVGYLTNLVYFSDHLVQNSAISGYMASSEPSWVCTCQYMCIRFVPGTIPGTFERNSSAKDMTQDMTMR